MTDLIRTIGQTPILPGAVAAGGLAFTSGVVSPAALAAIGTEERIPVGQQVSQALEALLGILADAGCGPADVVRVEAYLSSADAFPLWNENFLAVWPQPGPARTTLVAGFTSPAIAFELQAIARVPADRSDSVETAT